VKFNTEKIKKVHNQFSIIFFFIFLIGLVSSFIYELLPNISHKGAVVGMILLFIAVVGMKVNREIKKRGKR